MDAPYDMARTRELLGLVCRSLGDNMRAALELDAAEWTFRQLGARVDLARVQSHSRRSAEFVPGGLTPRELEAADRVVDGKARLVAYCAIETFSVLTRLPPPHRVPAHLVRDFLVARFPDPYVGLDSPHYHGLILRLVELGISGGAVYDALIAATARAADDLLVSCDRRAAQVYERIGVRFRLID